MAPALAVWCNLQKYHLAMVASLCAHCNVADRCVASSSETLSHTAATSPPPGRGRASARAIHAGAAQVLCPARQLRLRCLRRWRAGVKQLRLSRHNQISTLLKDPPLRMRKKSAGAEPSRSARACTVPACRRHLLSSPESSACIHTTVRADACMQGSEVLIVGNIKPRAHCRAHATRAHALVSPLPCGYRQRRRTPCARASEHGG